MLSSRMRVLEHERTFLVCMSLAVTGQKHTEYCLLILDSNALKFD